MNFFRMFKYPFLSGIALPFKIYIKAGITIRKNADVKMKGRLTIGNPDAESARVSLQPANLYFGHHSAVTLGKSISIGPGVNIIVKDNAKLKIGDRTYFTSDMHLEAVNSIEIGSDCAISWGVTIIDDDHHQILPKKTGGQNFKNVKIGDHVWIGCNVSILKGTQIGNNCVIAAGSIVKGVFPDNALIGGNPAKVIKESISWE